MSETFSNNHLQTIFEEVIPAIEAEGIPLFVYGGIAVASLIGHFARKAGDVDTYVHIDKFGRVEEVLKKLCREHGTWDGDSWKIWWSCLKGKERPKLDLAIRGEQLFAVIPIFGSESDGYWMQEMRQIPLPRGALTPRNVNIGGFSFTTPAEEVIRQILRDFIEDLIDRKNPESPFRDVYVRTTRPIEKNIEDGYAILPLAEMDVYRDRFKALGIDSPAFR